MPRSRAPASTFAPTTTQGIAAGSVVLSITANATVGSFNVLAAAGGAVSQSFMLTNTLRPVQVTLTGAPNPSLVGATVTFTATVAELQTNAFGALGGVVPTGDVALVGETGITLTTVALVGSSAVFTKADWAAGIHTVTAYYVGDSAFAAGASIPTPQVVQPQFVAVNDAAGTLQETAVTIPVLANDRNPAGGSLTVISVTQPGRGSAAIDAGSQTVTFTPGPGVSGVFTFTYVGRDANQRSDEALVSVVVSARSETGSPPQIAAVNPAVNTTVAFSSPGVSLVGIQMRAGAFTGTVTAKEIFYLAYTPLITPTGDINQPPSGLEFGNFVFDLSVYLNGRLLSPVTFAQPVTLTFTYSAALLAGLNEATLTVYYWNGTAWANDGIVVIGRDPVNHTLIVTITHLTEFGFFAAMPTGIGETPEPEGSAWKIFLPAIGQESSARDATAPGLPAGTQPIYLPFIVHP